MDKRLFKLLAFSLVFIFSSCGSDDDKKVAEYFTGDCKQVVSLEWKQANSTITTAPDTMLLEDMLRNQPGFGSPIASGELLVAGSNTSARVTGLPADASLKDFKVNINGIEENFGEISRKNANLNLYTDKHIDFFRNAFNRMVSDKQLITKVTFTSDIAGIDDVKLEIVFSGRFAYWVRH